MGHPSFKVLKQLSLIDSSSSTMTCDACSIYLLAKQTRLPFPDSLTRADLVHIDVWGPYRFPTHNDFWFFFTIVDDRSRMIWLFSLKFNSDIFPRLKSFFTLVRNQFATQVKRIR